MEHMNACPDEIQFGLAPVPVVCLHEASLEVTIFIAIVISYLIMGITNIICKTNTRVTKLE